MKLILNLKKIQDWKDRLGLSDNEADLQMKYIFQEIHPHDLMILNELFHPTLIEIEGHFILKIHFDKKSYSVASQRFSGKELEQTMNRTHIYDLFGKQQGVNDDDYKQIAFMLRDSWQAYFNYQFSERNINIKVELIESEFEYGPVLTCFLVR